MNIPPPTKLVRQTCDMPLPQMDPVAAAEWSKVLWGYHDAYWKPIMEQAYAKDREWRLANKDMIEAKEAAWEQAIKDGKVKKTAWNLEDKDKGDA